MVTEGGLLCYHGEVYIAINSYCIQCTYYHSVCVCVWYTGLSHMCVVIFCCGVGGVWAGGRGSVSAIWCKLHSS